MSFMDEIRKIPPVTRFLSGSLLAVSLPVMMHVVSPYKVLFVKQLVTQKFEVRHSISAVHKLSTRTGAGCYVGVACLHEFLPWK